MANPLWGSPRIVGELKKLGIDVALSTVAKYRVRRPGPRSQGWKTFLSNHLRDFVSIDFFTIPTARFKVLFVLVILLHFRRRVAHFNVTEHPTAEWTGQQIIEAFPWDEAPGCLLRDRDGIYGEQFRLRIKNIGIEEILTAPRSPWQNPFVERLIGSVRQECLDHVIVFDERHLRRVLKGYFQYHQQWRTHLSLEMDCPRRRPVQRSSAGRVVELPEVGGLHHHYERLAA
jgi:putative transposase